MERVKEILRDLFNKYLMEMTWLTILFLLSSYIAISWVGLTITQEYKLTKSVQQFLYYIITTGSTVGYGDLSPLTDNGKLLTAFFIIPCGISLFALVLGKMAVGFSEFWFIKRKGKHKVKIKGHIIIIGINLERTPYLLSMLKREEKGRREIIVVSKEFTESPFEPDIHFINVNSFTDIEEMNRSNLTEASAVIVDTDSDDSTLTLSLFIAEQNSKAHLVASFNDSVKAELLHKYCPNSECIRSLSTELLAKSVMDKGSSLVHSELVSAHKGHTQYSIKIPESMVDVEFELIYISLKKYYQATAIAIQKQNREMILNPNLSYIVTSGTIIYYIADERINDIDWSLIKR
ncbi:potassium channel related protein [Aliivibrio fischeri]|uniref:potassium channel protein n=1 Tax=Aliivibrio fischeri TaxID=668 RepID=UPI0012DA50DB|nr:potassium channel family protein [Aliivibrio fischeri]MUK94631.1 potassium channel related protein [Aliivibrio fischeri]